MILKRAKNLNPHSSLTATATTTASTPSPSSPTSSVNSPPTTANKSSVVSLNSSSCSSEERSNDSSTSSSSPLVEGRGNNNKNKMTSSIFVESSDEFDYDGLFEESERSSIEILPLKGTGGGDVESDEEFDETHPTKKKNDDNGTTCCLTPTPSKTTKGRVSSLSPINDSTTSAPRSFRRSRSKTKRTSLSPTRGGAPTSTRPPLKQPGRTSSSLSESISNIFSPRVSSSASATSASPATASMTSDTSERSKSSNNGGGASLFTKNFPSFSSTTSSNNVDCSERGRVSYASTTTSGVGTSSKWDEAIELLDDLLDGEEDLDKVYKLEKIRILVATHLDEKRDKLSNVPLQLIKKSAKTTHAIGVGAVNVSVGAVKTSTKVVSKSVSKGVEAVGVGVTAVGVGVSKGVGKGVEAVGVGVTAVGVGVSKGVEASVGVVKSGVDVGLYGVKTSTKLLELGVTKSVVGAKKGVEASMGVVKTGLNITAATMSSGYKHTIHKPMVGPMTDTVKHILKEFGGITTSDVDSTNKSLEGDDPLLSSSSSSTNNKSTFDVEGFERQAKSYVLPEFDVLPKEKQVAIFKMLSWSSIKQWDFNIFDLVKITEKEEYGHGNPLLFVGWAVLGSPYSQYSMAKTIGYINNNNDDNDDLSGFKGYNFTSGSTSSDGLRIPPSILCNYLRRIQNDYHSTNPYHNAIHAADVVQSCHALIQMLLSNNNNNNRPQQQQQGQELPYSSFTQIQLFSILLAAVVHDVDHPGQTNTYQENARTNLALTYNDQSILENRHASHAFRVMLLSDYTATAAGASSSNSIIDDDDHDSSTVKKQKRRSSLKKSITKSLQRRASLDGSKNGNHKDNSNNNCNNNMEDCRDYNLLQNVSPTQLKTIRANVIDAILHTDMSKHFAMVNSMKGTILLMNATTNANDDDENGGGGDSGSIADVVDKSTHSWKILTYLLHMADISGQAKGDPLFKLWTDRCLEEFFQQGDKERSKGLPVSPNCDRSTTVVAESQYGFVQYVILPAYEVLGQILFDHPSPQQQQDHHHQHQYQEDRILPIVKSNLEYWRKQKEENDNNNIEENHPQEEEEEEESQ